MVRKKLSLRTRGNGTPGNGPAISEEVAAALSLIETHGRRSGQVLVDEAQGAIRAGDNDRVSFLDRVRLALAVIDEASPAQRPQ